MQCIKQNQLVYDEIFSRFLSRVDHGLSDTMNPSDALAWRRLNYFNPCYVQTMVDTNKLWHTEANDLQHYLHVTCHGAIKNTFGHTFIRILVLIVGLRCYRLHIQENFPITRINSQWRSYDFSYGGAHARSALSRGVWGHALPGKFWISIVLKSFLVQSGGSRDRYSLGIHLNTDS